MHRQCSLRPRSIIMTNSVPLVRLPSPHESSTVNRIKLHPRRARPRAPSRSGSSVTSRPHRNARCVASHRAADSEIWLLRTRAPIVRKPLLATRGSHGSPRRCSSELDIRRSKFCNRVLTLVISFLAVGLNRVRRWQLSVQRRL